jgi:hypothetical protein
VSANPAAPWPKLAAAALAAALNVALQSGGPIPDLVWLHPVAPPLTHIPEMGEAVLGGTQPSLAPPTPPPPVPGHPPRPPLRGLAGTLEQVLRATGTPGQRAALDAARPDVEPLLRRSTALRLAIERDAIAIADLLGPYRVGAILAQKDSLSTRYGEGRAWSAAASRVEGPSGVPAP